MFTEEIALMISNMRDRERNRDRENMAKFNEKEMKQEATV